MFFKVCLTASLVVLSFCSFETEARQYSFDKSWLGVEGERVDLSFFESNSFLPGVYPVTIVLNGQAVDYQNIQFSVDKNKDAVIPQPCLLAKQLVGYGVRSEVVSGALPGKDVEGCVDFSKIDASIVKHDIYDQQLVISLPQAAMQPKFTGVAPQVMWDDGIAAFLMNYRVSSNKIEYDNSDISEDNHVYAQLTPGFNIGPWRFRNMTTYQKARSGTDDWESVYSYFERGINAWQSRFSIGDRYTPGDIFDSIPFRGVMLATDDRMVPYSQRTFSPIVRGIAKTQARVEVKQNGYTIYDESISPGAFELLDIQSSGSSGDLEVTVTESDGSVQSFVIPFTTPAIALRQGFFKYNIMGGYYNANNEAADRQFVSQATVMYGLPYDLTVFGGGQVAEHYKSTSVGIGAMLGHWGAMSLDNIFSWGDKKDKTPEQGGAWRLRYNKELHETQTSFGLASYQYASDGFNTVTDVLDTYHYGDNGLTSDLKKKRRSTFDLYQTLGGWGSVRGAASRDYYSDGDSSSSLTVGYSGNIKDVFYSIDFTKNRTVDSTSERLFNVMLSVPIGISDEANVRASYQAILPSPGVGSHEIGLNGDAIDQQFHWDVKQRFQSSQTANNGNNGSLGLMWRGAYGEVGANYNYSQSMHQVGASVAGSVMVHSDGITLGQTLGTTVSLVEVPGVSNIDLSGQSGARTDFRGFAIGSQLVSYQENTISVGTKSDLFDVDIPYTSTTVVPTEGAVVKSRFFAHVGKKALFKLLNTDGGGVPFGAVVNLNNENSVFGIVGDDSELYMSGLPIKGVLIVKWGNLSNQRCQVDYELPDEDGDLAGMYSLTGVCH